jgi:hypothetical protein
VLSKTNKYKTKQTNGKKKYQKEKKNLHECTFYQSDLVLKGVEGVLPKSLPGVQKLLHNINTHRYCVPKTQIIWLSNLLILSYLMNVIPEHIIFIRDTGS